MKAINSTSVGAGGRRNVQKQPRTFNYGDSSAIWDPKRSMTEQLKEEKELLFGKQAVKVYGMDTPQLAVPVASPMRVPPTGWLTRAETAEALGVSAWTLDHWTHPIQLKHVVVKTPYKAFYYDPEIIRQIQKTDWYTKRGGKKRVYGKTEEEKKADRQKYRREYRQNNEDKLREYNNDYAKKQYAEDPQKYRDKQSKYRQNRKNKQEQQNEPTM